MMNEELLKKANTLFYFLTKKAASYSFVEFLSECELSMDEYKEIKQEIKEKVGVTEFYI